MFVISKIMEQAVFTMRSHYYTIQYTGKRDKKITSDYKQCGAFFSSSLQHIDGLVLERRNPPSHAYNSVLNLSVL